MSIKRQSSIFDRLADRRSSVVTLTHDYAAGYVIPLHFHDRDQLVYASQGVMTVRTDNGTWVVPTHRAVWIPEAVAHTITMSGTVAMRTLYFKPKLVRSLPRDCCVVNVSPLLNELILHICTRGALGRRVAWQRHLIDVVIDQLKVIQTVPLQLPNLFDPRAQRVAEALMAEPGDPRPLGQICRKSGATLRTIERLFQDDVGMTLGRWRQQLRLMQAMRLLGGGAKVTQAALEAGYSTPSAFIAAFRRSLGTTPTLYFKKSVKERDRGRRDPLAV
jgi:AraC-like DNA-binding protein/quercetin dioxygenase-like cupin family protein